jgi:hypothetical protein
MRAPLAAIRRLLASRKKRRLVPAPCGEGLCGDLAYLVAAARGVC